MTSWLSAHVRTTWRAGPIVGAYVATFTTEEGVSIFDVSDPSAPVHLGGLIGVFARSVDILDYGERVAIAISGNTQLDVYEVTDPADPQLGPLERQRLHVAPRPLDEQLDRALRGRLRGGGGGSRQAEEEQGDGGAAHW